jgi:hypothetical protein
VSGKLTPLLSQKFLTPDQFAKKARSYLTPKEWDQYQDKVVSHAQAQGEFEVVKVANGHVAVVVDSTTLYHGKYPYVWGGSIGEAQSQGDKSVGEVWNTKDRDKVKIWRSKTPVP